MPVAEVLKDNQGKLYTALGIAGLVAGIVTSHAEPGSAHVSSTGKGYIESLTLGEGTYNNAEAQIRMEGVASTYSWRPRLDLSDVPGCTSILSSLCNDVGVSSPVHATIKETVDQCTMRVQPWIKMRAAQTVQRINGKYNFILHTSSDPEKSDIGLTVFEKDPLQCKQHSDGGNWVSRLNDATFGEVGATLNAILQTNYNDKSQIFSLLASINRLQIANYISQECAGPMDKALAGENIPGGNMGQRMLRDIFSNIPAADRKQYKIPSTSDIRFHIVPISPTDTGLPNQWSSVIAHAGSEVSGLSFQKGDMATCDDVTNGVTVQPTK